MDDATIPLDTGPGGPLDPADLPWTPDPAEAPAMVRRHLRARRASPARRFALYASGVDLRVLWYAPIDETEFVVQGTLVALTALVACVSGLAASSFLVAGGLTVRPVTVAVGLAWGTLIFFFDRALVSGSLNPYRFDRDEVSALRYTPGGSVWSQLTPVEGGAFRRGVRRLGEIVRVLAVASLRVVLAVATSFIAAEMVLFLVFAPEISARAGYMQQRTAAQRVAAIQATFATEAKKRTAQRDAMSGGNDPEVVRLRTRAAALAAELARARRDLGLLQSAAAAEHDGVPFTAKLSDGTTITSTGLIGNGVAARTLAARRDETGALVRQDTAALAATNTATDARLAALARIDAGALAALDALDNRAAADEKAAIAAATDGSAVVTGLLIRQAALNQLVNDRKPETVARDPLPPCRSWLCPIHRLLLPPTPMGPLVVAWRVIFFVIEILPIGYKVLASLRRRRPYDAVRAALEEASVADAIRLADRHLHDASAEIVAREHLSRMRTLSLEGSEPP